MLAGGVTSLHAAIVAALLASRQCLAVHADQLAGFDPEDGLSLLQVSSLKKRSLDPWLPPAIEVFADFDPDASLSAEEIASREQRPFRFGRNIVQDLHPQSIAKPFSQANQHGVGTMQYYEAALPEMTAMVLNIGVMHSNGQGGLTLLLEVPSPCAADQWTTVDRTRCSMEYACALRLPAQVGDRSGFVRFRTRAVEDDEGYGTDVLRYQVIWLDYESVVVLARSEASPSDEQVGTAPTRVRQLSFRMSKAMASGSLEVIPQIIGASDDTRFTMKIRQIDVDEPKFPWAKVWRSPTTELEGCSYRIFEVVAEDLFEGLVEMEFFLSGDDFAELGTVLVSSRVGIAGAEVNLLDSILQSHSKFFIDPQNMVHGLPMTSINPIDLASTEHSNPTEWGYALTALATMGQLLWIPKEQAAERISVGLSTMDHWQNNPHQFMKGMFFPYYDLRENNKSSPRYGKILRYPHHTSYKKLPCGDNALLYSSLMVVKGWLLTSEFYDAAALADRITSKFDFSKCMHRKICPNKPTEEQPWAVAMTVEATNDTLFPYDWNVWADEGGVVGLTAMLRNAMSEEQFHSMVGAQYAYSPCQTWLNVTVTETAYFNSVFTLPTRSFMGFGTLFSSAAYHEFYIRSVVPTFRAHQATKKLIGDDFYGPSDAMSQGLGSVAFFPPNTQHDPCFPEKEDQNRCTWCEARQYLDSDSAIEPHHLTIPNGITAAFLAVAAMETSQLEAWVDDLKLLITDASGIYNKSYGLEVLGPNRRTKLGEEESLASYIKASAHGHGVGYFESLAHAYTYLSIYEGMAAARRRFEILRDEGAELRGPEPPSLYRPLSDFLDSVPDQRQRINDLLAMVKPHENTKICEPSAYFPSPRHDL